MATLIKIESFPELGLEQPNRLHIQESYLRQIANGTPHTAAKKNKARVKASSAKLYRQKGTGRARQGERTNPHMRGGGLAFPPRPRLQNKKLNKYVRRSALRSAVMWHVLNGSAFRIEGTDFGAFTKTKEVAGLLKTVENNGRVCLVVPTGADVNRACRNIGSVRLCRPEGLNVRDLIESTALVFDPDAFAAYNQIIKLQNTGPEGEEVAADSDNGGNE
jgi:large subunit ribosomal protein L4